MAQCWKKVIVLHPLLIKSHWSNVGMVAHSALRSICDTNDDASGNIVRNGGMLDMHNNLNKIPTFKQFPLCTQPQKLYWEGSSHTALLGRLESALKEHQVDEAWETLKDFKHLYGFPEYSLLSQLLTEMLYSTDSKWLLRAFNLTFSISKEKSALLKLDLLTKLCLSLARAQMPNQASVILRLMLGKRSLPSVDTLGMVFLHLVKTETGAILASNILVEICDLCRQLIVIKSNSAMLIKPDTMMFNLVLDACVRFESSLKGQQLIELMAQAGVVADAHTILFISQIYEMNCMRDELKRFKKHIDLVSAPLVCHYGQFYDSLLSLHFIFNDIDAAAALILDMYRNRDSNLVQEGKREPCVVPIGSPNLRMGLKLRILPELLQKDTVLRVEGNPKLVMNKNGKPILSNNALAKLIREYKRHGRINELSKLLISIQNKLASSDSDKLCSNVIDAFIHLGWLETAHDVLDDLASEVNPQVKGLYISLLTAYYHRKMFKEGGALFIQIRKAGLLVDMPDGKVTSKPTLKLDGTDELSFKRLCSPSKPDLVESIVQDMEEEIKSTPGVINELNSSIYFFMKAKMIGDALKTYQRIQEMKIRPTVLTFANLIDGYSSLRMYREITILWGDIKRNMEHGNSMVYRDLYESLLLNFIRGGYFERVLEVIAFMTERGMYLDKWMYKREYLKFHKDLYWSLKASDARNEVQVKRLEHVQAFRNWVGIKVLNKRTKQRKSR